MIETPSTSIKLIGSRKQRSNIFNHSKEDDEHDLKKNSQFENLKNYKTSKIYNVYVDMYYIIFFYYPKSQRMKSILENLIIF